VTWQPIETTPRDGSPVKVRRVFDGEVTHEGMAYYGDLTVDYGEDAIALNMEPIHIHHGVWVRCDCPYLFPSPTEWLAD